MRMSNAPKKPINLSVNGELLTQAKAAGINLSAVLEKALSAEVKRLRAEAWLHENREAIQNYNQDLESQGNFADHFRAF